MTYLIIHANKLHLGMAVENLGQMVRNPSVLTPLFITKNEIPKGKEFKAGTS